MNKIYVVTSTELGWDCIVGAFDPEHVTKEQLKKHFNCDSDIIHTLEVQKNLQEYE